MACADCCPTGAIGTRTDDCGFIYPEVDASLCVECGKCEDVCAFRAARPSCVNIRRAFAFRLSDKAALGLSTSGGAFTALSDGVLSRGGVIVGAVMQDDFTVIHIAAETARDRDRMRLSKYAQSDTSGVFKMIKDLLLDGREVMFVGTPCQCGELHRFIGGNDRLLICEFLCHGVPSNAFFLEHIRYLEACCHKQASGYTFRGKRYGWNHGIEEITFTDGSYRDDRRVQCYAAFFQSGVSLRESCRSCVYRSRHRSADITIADFWGLEKITGQSDREGVSLVLANSPRGEQAVLSLSKSGRLDEVAVDRILYRIPTEPAKSAVDTEGFWGVYLKDGYAGVVKRYFPSSVKESLKHELKKKLKNRR